MITWSNLDTLPSYKKMLSLKGQVKLAEVLGNADAAKRVAEYSVPK